MSRIGNGLLGCKVAALAALMTVLSGCGSLQIKSGEASAKFAFPPFLEVSAKVQFEKNPSEKSIPFGSQEMATAIAADSRLDLSAGNAQIPDQTTLATVTIKNGSGSTVAAKTFVAKVVSGRGTFNDPAQVENWFNSISVPDSGSIAIDAPDIEIRPPQQGHYTATNKLVIANQVVASATAYGYIPPGGGDSPPTHPK